MGLRRATAAPRPPQAIRHLSGRTTVDLASFQGREATMSGLIWTILVGFIVGLIARLAMPGKQVMGWFMTTLFGCGGAVLATYAGKALGLYKVGEPAGFIGAVVGAFVLLFIYGKVIGK
jgi:uncharacterized membrane protein YeaQ/YmgE (transglycosylase-associated protein family)